MTWTLDVHGPTALLTFDRPPRNFMTFALLEQLSGHLEGLAAREDVNVVVLTGAVPGYFVAHADLDDLAKLGRGEEVEGSPRAWNRTLGLLESMPQPVVAAINGQAHGGGCELALACTLRVAAQSGHVALPEIETGIIPGAGGTQRLPRLVGPGPALELILSGRVVMADEAQRLGIVSAVLPDDNFVQHALDWAGRLARHPRHALVAGKRAVLDGIKLPMPEALRLEAALFLPCQADPVTLGLQAELLRRYETSLA